jgi:hypothetical protein
VLTLVIVVQVQRTVKEGAMSDYNSDSSRQGRLPVSAPNLFIIGKENTALQASDNVRSYLFLTR